MANVSSLPVIEELLRSGCRLEVWCFGCGHEQLYFPDEAVVMLGAATTFPEARRRFRCSACGRRGSQGSVGARACIIDVYAAINSKVGRGAVPK